MTLSDVLPAALPLPAAFDGEISSAYTFSFDKELSLHQRMNSSKEFELLFRRGYPRLCHIAAGMLGDREAAEDVVQDCFVSFWEMQTACKAVQSPEAFMTTMVRHRCIDLLRKQSVEVSAEDETVQSRMADLADQTADEHKPSAQDIVEQALSMLPYKCRCVFELSRLHGKSYREIADSLNISVKTVENQMGKGIRAMRQFAAEHPDLFTFILLFNLLWK